MPFDEEAVYPRSRLLYMVEAAGIRHQQLTQDWVQVECLLHNILKSNQIRYHSGLLFDTETQYFV